MENGNNLPLQAVQGDDDVSQARNVFERAANAMLQNTQMARDIAEMRAKTAQSDSDINRLRRANDVQADMLDKAERELAAVKDELRQALVLRQNLENTCKALEQENATYHNTNTTLADKLSATYHERDEAQYNLLEAQDKIKALQAKIDRIASIGGELLGAIRIKETNIPTAPVDTTSDYIPPAPQAEPIPTDPAPIASDSQDFPRERAWWEKPPATDGQNL